MDFKEQESGRAMEPLPGGNSPPSTSGLTMNPVATRAKSSSGGAAGATAAFTRVLSLSVNSPSFRQQRSPFIIGVAGGTASGKTTVWWVLCGGLVGLWRKSSGFSVQAREP